MKNINFKNYCIIASLFISANSYAEEYSLLNPVPEAKLRPMTTERPSKGISSYTIDSGHLQIETSLYSFTKNKDKGLKTTQKSAFNSTTFRLGTTQDSEISLVVTPFIWQKTKTETSRSNVKTYDDVTVRFKKNIFGNDANDGRSLAIMPHLKIPTGGNDLGNNSYEGGVTSHYDHKLNDDYSFSYLFDISAVKKTDNSSYLASFSNVFGISKSITSKISSYFEFASFKTAKRGESAQNYLDFGSVYQVSKNLTIDIVTNFGISNSADDFNFITGFAYRF